MSDVIERMREAAQGAYIHLTHKDVERMARVLLADMRRYNDAMGDLPISKQPARIATVSQHVRAYAKLIGVWPLTSTADSAQEAAQGEGTAPGASTPPGGGTSP